MAGRGSERGPTESPKGARHPQAPPTHGPLPSRFDPAPPRPQGPAPAGSSPQSCRIFRSWSVYGTPPFWSPAAPSGVFWTASGAALGPRCCRAWTLFRATRVWDGRSGQQATRPTFIALSSSPSLCRRCPSPPPPTRVPNTSPLSAPPSCGLPLPPERPSVHDQISAGFVSTPSPQTLTRQNRVRFLCL